jgi:hypothetical protein
MVTVLTRRRFSLNAAAVVLAQRLSGQSPPRDVAALEHDRILLEAAAARRETPRSAADLSAVIAVLTAAFVLTKDESYAKATQPLLLKATAKLISTASQPPTVVSLIPYAEMARASSFLVDALDLTQANAFFADLLQWLHEARTPVIERDTKDHRASAWLLLTAALARSQREEKILAACAHRLKTPTLRNQIDANGYFPQEMATPNPFRNTLFNFDLLAGACQLLSSSFDDLWDYELADGPGLRSVAAALYPVIAAPSKWPGVADAQHFRELPGRRPALLFCGRAYHRPEYVALWESTPATVPVDIADSFPIRQPLLWITRAEHGL